MFLCCFNYPGPEVLDGVAFLASADLIWRRHDAPADEPRILANGGRLVRNRVRRRVGRPDAGRHGARGPLWGAGHRLRRSDSCPLHGGWHRGAVDSMYGINAYQALNGNYIVTKDNYNGISVVIHTLTAYCGPTDYER